MYTIPAYLIIEHKLITFQDTYILFIFLISQEINLQEMIF